MRFHPKLLLVLSFLLLTAYGCKKSGASNGGGGGGAAEPPAVTVVGTAVGNPVSKSIGSAGGILNSPDGRLAVTIPAGALSTNTTIAIQPITNESPGGVGMAYQLLPEGTVFASPVTITFHYNDDDLSGTHPFAFFVAFQDSTHTWKANFKQQVIDTVARTLSLKSTHFSSWTIGSNLRIEGPQDKFHENETNYLEVKLVLAEAADAGDDLVALPIEKDVAANLVTKWSINGQGPSTLTLGSISGTGNKVNYKAPAVIDIDNTVQVSVEIAYSKKIYSGGVQIAQLLKFVLFKNLQLLTSTFKFNITINYIDNSITGYVGQTYRDKGSVDIEIGRGVNGVLTITGSNYQNQVPTVVPVTMTYAFTTPPITYTWIPDDFGEINITGVASNQSVLDDGDSLVDIQLLNTSAVTPKFNFTVTGGPSGQLGGIPLGDPQGLISDLTINIKQDLFIQKDANGNNLITVTKK